MDSSCGDSAKPHGDALRPSAGGPPPAPPPAALASAGPAARVGDALRAPPRPSLPLAPTASAADSVGAAAAAAGAATTTLGAEGRGSSPCAGLAAHETLGGVFPPSAFAAHGDASALAASAALGLPAAAARALDSEAPPEDAGDDERFCRSALRQRELALPPSHDGSRHGDALVAGRALVAASFEPSVTAAHPRE
jgi:hypothetical protein